MGVLDLHLLDAQLLEAQELKPWFSKPGIDLTKRKSGMHFFEMQVETKKK